MYTKKESLKNIKKSGFLKLIEQAYSSNWIWSRGIFKLQGRKLKG